MYLGNGKGWIGVPSSYYIRPRVPLDFRIPGAGPRIFQRPVIERRITKPLSKRTIKPPTIIKPLPVFYEPIRQAYPTPIVPFTPGHFIKKRAR